LAGLSLGIALCKAGVPTEIFEAGEYPRHRVCGEFIAGLDDETIDKLGIRSAFIGTGFHRTVTWFLRGKAFYRQTLPEGARAVSRHALDARLAELFVASQGRLSVHTRLSPMSPRPGLVLANGRKPSASSRWLGLKLHARNLTTNDELEMHLGDGAYVGLSAVEDGWINICGLFLRRPGLQFTRGNAMSAYLVASGLHSLADQLAAADIQPDSRCAVAGFEFERGEPAGDCLRLGDAWAMVPPFTGDGMAMAFTSAALALDPVASWARGEQPWDKTVRCIQAALGKKFRVRLTSASLLHPFLFNRMWQHWLYAAAYARLLPITTLYRLVH
jgi:flavin-dependent dehydrogenase